MAQPLVAIPMSTPTSETQPELMAPAPRARRESSPEADPPTDHIIRSKVQAPVVRDSTIARVRLLQWLDMHAADRVRVIGGEAGFGKTTLLADWSRRLETDVRWLKLDPTDADWSTFISYLVAAFREGDPSFGRATLRLLAHVATLGTTMDQALGQFLAELGRSVDRPTLLIIDDLQHVHGNAEVRAIIERLLERAPATLTFILSGRSRPGLRLGRQTAQGNVVSLDTDDLRFTRQEIEDLFTHGYRMPLDGDLMTMVEARTEGWAASLQLLHSTLRGQSPSEIRDFIGALRGSREPVYDFLAEEVLERQPHVMQQVLLHASILDRIAPDLVVAALSATEEPLPSDTVMATLDQADELGLMSRNALGSSSRRFHPLLREFLESHLVMTTTVPQYRAIHLAVARAAEGSHWPTSAHHYIEADEGHEAMRVIGDASITVLGSGQWGAALALTDRIPEVAPSTRVQVIRSRGMVASGDANGAVRLLTTVGGESVVVPRDAPLVKLALASALAATERFMEVPSILADLVQDDIAPELVKSVAAVWLEMYTSSDTLGVANALAAFARLAERHELLLYAGIAHHNRSSILLARGSSADSISAGREALTQLSHIPDHTGHLAAVHSTLAQGHFELGAFGDCLESLRAAGLASQSGGDAWAEASVLHTWMGHGDEADVTLSRAMSLVHRSQSPIERSVLQLAESLRAIARGDLGHGKALAMAAETNNFDPNLAGAVLFARATAAALTESRLAAMECVQQSLIDGRDRGIFRWVRYLELVEASLSDDPRRLRMCIEDDATFSDAAILASADAIGPRIEWHPEPESRLGRLVRRWPDRWRPILRRALHAPLTSTGQYAAALLGEVGEAQDVAAILRWEQRAKRKRDSRVSLALARRISPTLRIHDLGRTIISVGDREIRLADVRRRASSLLLYLVSRPKQAATREQVLDALWPDLDPTQAGNSLHQTLYFLRRDLVSGETTGRPAVDYVPMEAEMLYLDPDLVHIDSVAFARQAADLASRAGVASEVPLLLEQYQGQFAPEFEYEEWALPWRGQTHGLFLRLSEQFADAALRKGQPTVAAGVLTHALEIDPTALELRPMLVVALHRSGSAAAAKYAYRQLEAHLEREFENPPAPLAELLASYVADRRLGTR